MQSVDGGLCKVSIGDKVALARSRLGLAVGDVAALVVRPEQVLLGEDAAQSANPLSGVVLDHTYQGSFIRYRVDVGGHKLVAEVANRSDQSIIADGTKVAVAWQAEGASLTTN